MQYHFVAGYVSKLAGLWECGFECLQKCWQSLVAAYENMRLWKVRGSSGGVNVGDSGHGEMRRREVASSHQWGGHLVVLGMFDAIELAQSAKIECSSYYFP